jgi:general stress protein YciG
VTIVPIADQTPTTTTRRPTTPTDEPKPVPVQDPPAEPDQSPYVVEGRQSRAVIAESSTMNETAKGRMPGERKERRGFASMSPEKQREIASKGGRAAHAEGHRARVDVGGGPLGRPQGRADQPRRPWAPDRVRTGRLPARAERQG